MTNELKPCAPCPFCPDGGRVIYGVQDDIAYCATCGAAALRTAWNRRAPSEAVGLLRALMDRLDAHFLVPGYDWKEQEQARRFLAAQDKEST